MKCFVVFLMTLVVVNSFPLKNDEDSSLKRKVMSEIQQLCFFQMESLKILFFTFGESLLVSRKRSRILLVFIH